MHKFFQQNDAFKQILDERDSYIEELSKNNDQLSKAKIEALNVLFTVPRVRLEVSVGVLPVDILIYDGKLKQIREAETKQDLKEILAVPKVHYGSQGKVVPSNKWVLSAEELVMWSNTSLLAPLNHEGFERYMEVFKEVFPDKYRLLEEGSYQENSGSQTKVIPINKAKLKNFDYVQLSLFDINAVH